MTEDAPSPQTAEPRPQRSALIREIGFATIGVLGLLALVKHLAIAVPAWSGLLFTGAVAAQLYFPLWRLGRNGVDNETLGLRTDTLRADLGDLALACLVTGLPYAVLFHLWQSHFLGRSFVFRWPPGFVEQVLVEVLVIALAEELFFRGYLQERMEQLWPARSRLFGAPAGRAIVVTSAIFALAHFVGEYRPTRLAPFFPSLVFGLLKARRGTLLAPVGYHAFCNLLADILFSSHR